MSSYDAETFLDAAARGKLRDVEAALTQGADPNACDERGRTALHWAAQQGHLKIVAALLAAGASLDRIGDTGFSALRIAVGEGRLNIVKLMLRYGADANDTPPRKKDPVLLLAAAWNRARIVQVLIDAGADVNARDHEGRTAIFFAFMYGHRRLIDLLLRRGAELDLDYRDPETKKTVIELCVRNRWKGMAARLRTN